MPHSHPAWLVRSTLILLFLALCGTSLLLWKQLDDAQQERVRERVSFVTGALGAATVPVADAYYFFNPFVQYWLGVDHPVAAGADAIDSRLADDVAAAEDLLRNVPVGTWILTYNGFGGRMPASYQLVRADEELRGALRLWQKSP